MGRPSRRELGVAGLLAGAGVLVGGCGLRGANQFIPAAEAGSVKSHRSLADVRIVVGSKDFTEQLILGKMASILLAVAGADVVDQTGISGSVSARNALEVGEVDCYWEYTGTAWLTYLGHEKHIPDPAKQWEAVRSEDLAKNAIAWLPPAPLNNTYAMATTEEGAKELGVERLSDLAKLSQEELTFCVESEFAARNDGFEPMLKKYGVPLGSKVDRGKVRNMDTGVIYETTDKGGCNFGEVFTSDGRIKALGLRVLEDDKRFFPNYNVALTVRRELLEAHPELKNIFEPVTTQITTETMQDLNGRVDRLGEDPGLVARGWLRAKGFVR